MGRKVGSNGLFYAGERDAKWESNFKSKFSLIFID